MLRLLCIATLLCSSACAPRKPEPAHPLRWARAWIDSLNSRRWEQVGHLLGRGTYEDSWSRGPLDPVSASFYWFRIWEISPNPHFQLDRVTGDGHTIAVEWSADGLGTSASVQSGMFLLTVDGGSISSVRGYYRTLAFVGAPGDSVIGPDASVTPSRRILTAATSQASHQAQRARRT